MNPTQFVIFTLERLKARLRTNDLLTGLLALLAVALAWLLAVVVIDQAMVLSRTARLTLLVILAVLSITGLAVVLALPALRRVSDLFVARIIERHDEGRFRNSLTTFVEIQADPAAADDVRRAVAEKAARDLTELDVEVLVSRRPLHWLMLALATAGSVLLAFGLLAPRSFSASMARAVGYDVAPPTATRIVQLRPADGFRLVAGHPVTIELQLTGHLPDEATIQMIHADGHQQSKPMRRVADNLWEFAVADLFDDLRFSVEAGDARSAQHRLIVYALPQVSSATCQLFRPDYTRRPPQEIDSGNVEALPGTRVAITVRTNHPPEGSELRFDDGRSVPLRPLPDGSGASGEFFVGQTPASYRVAFRDREMHLENRNPVQYRITPLADRPPLVELSPPGPLELPVNRLVSLQLRASDDYGLASCQVDLHAVRQTASAAAELTAEPPAESLGAPVRSFSLLPEPVPPAPQMLPTNLAQVVSVIPAELGLKAGDLLIFRPRATDLAPGSSGPAVGALVTLRLTAPAEGDETARGSGGSSESPGAGEQARSTAEPGSADQHSGGEGSEDSGTAESGSGESGTSHADSSAGGAGTEDAANASGAGSSQGNGGSSGQSQADSGGNSGGGEESPSGSNPFDDLKPRERERLNQLANAVNKMKPSAGGTGDPSAASPEAEPGSGGEGPDGSGATEGSTPSGSATDPSATNPGTGSAATPASSEPRQRPEQFQESGSGEAGGNRLDPLLAAGPRIRRLADDLRRGQPLDPALLKELGWSEADLRQAVSQYVDRYDRYAGSAGTGSVRPPATAGEGADDPGQIVQGRGPLGTGSQDHQQASPGTGGTIVRPADRPVSPEYAELIEAYLRSMNQVE